MAKKPDSLETHQQRWGIVKDGRAYWNREARLDLKFSVGKVWTDEELEIFRLENRAATSYDLIRPVLRLVAGLEAQNRQDTKVLPRAQSDIETAEALTKISKYVGDQNSSARQLSRAFFDSISTGIGWLEVGFNPDPMAERLLEKRINPFDIWVDPNSVELDLSDARDIFRAVWMDPDDLAELFPQYADRIHQLVTDKADEEDRNAGDYTRDHGDRPPISLWDEEFGGVNSVNKQVRAIERWYRQTEAATFCRYNDGRVVEVTAETIAECSKAIVAGQAKPIKGLAKRIRVAIFVGDLLLQDAPSPFSHGRFPFVPMWCDWDEKGRPMGLVRQLRDPAKEFNARRTNSLSRLLNKQTVVEDGAVRDIDQFTRDVGKRNAVIVVNPGTLANGRIQFRDDMDQNPAELDHLQLAKQTIQDVSGATPELMGRQTNAIAAKAIEARQAQGQTTLFSVFDLRNWTQTQVGELRLANIQDTYTEEAAFRITESGRGLTWITVNQRRPDGAILNNITQGRYDVVVSEVPAHLTDQLAQAEDIAQFLSDAPPEVKLMFLEEIARLRNMPVDFVEKIGQVVNQLMAPPAPPPGALPPGAPPMPGMPPEQMPA